MSAVVLAGCTLQTPSMPSAPAVVNRTELGPAPVLLDVRTLVVGKHPGAVAQAMADLEQLGFSVIKRDRVGLILDDLDLGQPEDSPARLIHSGLLSGAEVVVLVEVEKAGGVSAVVVRAIETESGAVLWSGGTIATGVELERDPHQLVQALTHEAVLNGLTNSGPQSQALLFSHP
ncbi:hypothetical protein [Candidatus Nitrospira bockiana]